MGVMFKRRRAAEVDSGDSQTYAVQLHRIVKAEGWSWENDKWLITNSWAPIKVRGLRAARSQAHELRQMNRWAGPDYSPHVTIHDADGNGVPEW